MATVLVAGGSGLVGKRLCSALIERGYAVRILSRSKIEMEGVDSFHWNLEELEAEDNAFVGVDFVINLSGENIGKGRWSKSRKERILNSRVQSARLLHQKLKESAVKAYISASAVGYYGAQTSVKIVTEEDPSATDFLGTVCVAWEHAAEKLSEYTRVVMVRTGAVLSENGGIIAKMRLLVKMGLATPLGSGKQWLPWIHIEDLVQMYIEAIEDTNMKGPYNAVAPEQVTNRVFMRTLAKSMNRPFWPIPVPAFMIRLVVGEMAQVVTQGSRISSKKIQDTGYTFAYPTLSEAIQSIVKKR